VEAAGDHQVYDQEEVAIQDKDQALPHPLDRDNLVAHHLVQRRVDGPKKKRVAQPHSDEFLPEDART
jgi:hypothetical protein